MMIESSERVDDRRKSTTLRAVRRLAVPLRNAGLRGLLLFSPKTRVGGLTVASLSADDYFDDSVAKVSLALDLIGLHAPRRLGQVQRELQWVILVAGSANYFLPGLRAHVVGAREICEASPEYLAVSLVHEATHARLERLGFRFDPEREWRIEALCVDEAASLAVGIPGCEDLARHTRDALRVPWWGADRVRAQRLQQLEAHGIPTWVRRLYAAFTK